MCSDDAVGELVKGVTAQLWRSNGLMVTNAVLVAFMVAAGVSGRRYRHAGAIRVLFLGASTLYLPIVSYVASSIGKESCSTSGLDVFCHGRSYVAFLLIWTVLVQIVGTNTSAIVAGDDDHGGQKIGPSIQLLARTVWTSYLVFYYAGRGFVTIRSKYYRLDGVSYYKTVAHFLIGLCLLSLAKIMLKLYAFQKARKSLSLGRNSRLVAGYMEKLHGGDDGESLRGSPGDAQVMPPLILMGEEEQDIEETPHGYNIKQRNSRLVTVDMVWKLASAGDALLAPRPWLKDLCLSFALCKMLRCRFAAKTTAKALLAQSSSTKAFSFVLEFLLNNGSPERVFSVIANEISFVRDSYYSSLPTSNFGRLLPILNITVSLLIIIWCLATATFISHHFSISSHPNQIFCRSNPTACTFPPQFVNDNGARIVFGSIMFNALPTIFLFFAVVIAEAWEIVSYLCSNWVKITMLCNYTSHTSWQHACRMRTGLALVMKLRVKFRGSWSDQMGQMSLLPIPGYQQVQKKKHVVKVPSEVKVAIVDALKDSNGSLSKGTASLHKSRVGRDVLWACQGQGTSDVILAWHIATGIVEASHGRGASSTSAKKPIATHLSRYCAYLVAAAPELLPDDKAWSKKLYKALRGDIERALAGRPVERDGMAARLDERSEHEVIKRGVRLGRQLLELVPNEEARWALLASFWSEMLLYVAPSDNLKTQKKAIARGTELVTLVWALLTHAGIIARPSVANAV